MAKQAASHHGKITDMSIELNGKIVADKIAQELKGHIAREKLEIALGILQVGDEPSSTIYIQHKVKMANKLGIKVVNRKLPATTSEQDIINQLNNWNKSEEITGYIVQLPLPKKIRPNVIIDTINPGKDVDGLTITNKGLLATNQTAMLPATTRGILGLLDYYNIDVAGKFAVVLGRSNLVGLPTALALLHRHATVSIIHSKSDDAKNLIKQADIIIAAIGKPNYLTKELVKNDTIIIDVGISSMHGKLYGDADYPNLINHVAGITPVPGGIGPLTVISLYQNLVDIAINK